MLGDWRGALKVVGAWVLIVVGIAALILPVIPGIVLIALGLFLWSRVSRWPVVRRRWLRRRYPSWVGVLDRAEARVLGWLRIA